ncbi:hypothetical protein U5817_06690 [Aromatoleum evansii]|uniref:Uncharacterized protein n=1 Tax=Aromatoleum evansii TaxID=59406 RepID=A0ABZ1APE8_AROEV|nr:hypothetical protein U5817_06690 [Aromatoleum evansii]
MQANQQEQKRQYVLAECKRRGIRVTPTGKTAFRLVGAGVDLLVADLAFVDAASLAPAKGRSEWV